MLIEQKDNDPIDLSDWVFGEAHDAVIDLAAEQLQACIREQVETALRQITDSMTFVTTPWGTPVTDGPLTLEINFPYSLEDRRHIWTVDIEEALLEPISMYEHGVGGHVDDKHKPGLAQIRDQLRGIADQLDAAINREQDA